MRQVNSYKYVVIGSGPFGSTIAHKIATQLNQEVLLVDKRDHIGGNCFSSPHKETGIETHHYGSHIFHTSNKKVWDYVNLFSDFNDYRHIVYAKSKGISYTLPLNLTTINSFFKSDLSPQEARSFIEKESELFKNKDASNFEEKAKSLIGEKLYQAFFSGYSEKQWGTSPLNLPASTFSRLPIRYNRDHFYFSDQYEGIPTNGYGKLFLNMINHPNIHLKLKTDFKEIKPYLNPNALVIYSGPLDEFFHYCFGDLGWRTLTFEKEVHDCEDYQGCAVMNYVDKEIPYTRIHEFKHYQTHLPHIRKSQKTITFKEYSTFVKRGETPYYPVNSKEDREIFQLYWKESLNLKNYIFGGRLGSYQYFDMHQVFAQALHLFEEKVRPYDQYKINVSV